MHDEYVLKEGTTKPVWFSQALINMALTGDVYVSPDVSGQFYRVANGKLEGYRQDEHDDGWLEILAFNHITHFANETWYPVVNKTK